MLNSELLSEPLLILPAPMTHDLILTLRLSCIALYANVRKLPPVIASLCSEHKAAGKVSLTSLLSVSPILSPIMIFLFHFGCIDALAEGAGSTICMWVSPQSANC